MKATVYLHDVDGDILGITDPNERAVFTAGGGRKGERLTGFTKEPGEEVRYAYAFLTVTVTTDTGTTLSWYDTLIYDDQGYDPVKTAFGFNYHKGTDEEDTPYIVGKLPTQEEIQRAKKRAQTATSNAALMLSDAIHGWE